MGVDDDTAANRASELLEELETYIVSISKSPQMLTTKNILESTYNNLKEIHKNGSIELFKLVVHCLDQEMRVVLEEKHTPSVNVVTSKETDEASEIQSNIDILKCELAKLGLELEKNQEKHEGNIADDRSITNIRLKMERKQLQLGEKHPDVKNLKKN